MNNEQTNLSPSALFNYVDALDADNPPLRTVVISKDGMPKPLVGVSVVNDTTYQVYEPANGDIILQASLPVCEEDGTWEPLPISIITVDNSVVEDVATIVDSSVIHAVLDFFNNPDPTVRHFTLNGITDTVRGDSLNVMVERRRKLADLLIECEPQTRDNLVNWLDSDDNTSIVSSSNLEWSKATDAPELITIEYDYYTDEGSSTSQTISALTWHKQEDGKVTVVYHTLGGAVGSVTDKTLTLNVTERVDITEDVIKILVIAASDNEVRGFDLYVPGNIPYNLVPVYAQSASDTVFPFELQEHLTSCGIDYDAWSELIGENTHIVLNVPGWDIPVCDSSTDDVIDMMLKHLGTSDDDEYLSRVETHSSESGESHLIVFPETDESVFKTAVVYYTTPQPVKNAEEDTTPYDSHKVTLSAPQHNTYITPVLTADK